MQLEIALALSSCATAEVNIVIFVTWVCLVICMIPTFIPFPSPSNIYKINVRPMRLYLTLPTANCNADIAKT